MFKSISGLSFQNKSIAYPFLMGLAAIIVLGSGCASTGTIQPHQAFRQATPYQGYQQQGFAGFSPQGLGAGDYVGYGGYNNSLPGQSGAGFGAVGQSNPAAGFGGSQPRSFAQPPVGNFSQYAPSYNYQPSYGGGFTSGSC